MSTPSVERGTPPASAEAETGDRAGFIGHLRQRLAIPVTENPAHPMPPPNDGIPLIHSSLLDPDDVVGSFVANATNVGVVVHTVDGAEVPPAVLVDVVARHGVVRAVVGRDVSGLGAVLEAAGVDVQPATKATSAAADLGVTGAQGAIATTGTLVQHSGQAGGRTASLLPRVHLCVVKASTIVPTSAEVLRNLGRTDLPSNIVLVTGPSRSGDIEQIITVGVHGPVVVEVVLLLGA